MSAGPYAFIKQGNLFVAPIKQVAAAPLPSLDRARRFSMWINGKIEEPPFQLDQAPMPPTTFQAVRDDINRFSPVKVSRSALRRSQHAYVGVIDSNGTPYHFALDSRGFSIEKATVGDAWRAFDKLIDEERVMATESRRHRADVEMRDVEHELSSPQPPLLVIMKSEVARVSRSGRQFSVATSTGNTDVPSSSAAEDAIQHHLPSGFKVGGAVNLHRASVHEGAPRGAADPDAIHVMKPSEIAARGVHGNELHPEHLDSIRSAWNEGKRLDPIDVNVTHDGQWHVEDGNHRLHVAAATDAPVALRFRQQSKDYRPQAGVRDISDRLRSAQSTEKSDFDWKRKTKERVGKKPEPSPLTKAEQHTGTMISLHLPAELADRIALPDGESPSTMHITLAYLGKDLTEEQKLAAACAVRRFSQYAYHVRAVLGGVGRFSASTTTEGRDVVYLSVDSPDITRLRPKLLDELAAEGLVPNDTHGFIPHVTLAYVATTARTPIKRFPPTPVEFTRVSLAVANTQIHFPFQQERAMLQAIHGSQPSLVIKALPKKPKTDEAKKTPNKKTSSKKIGSGGKTRYGYLDEKKKKPAGGGAKGQQQLVIVRHDDTKHADPGELANQLGVSVRTLQRAAEKLGRDGFAKFMRAHLKRFSAKHRIDPSYWHTLHTKLEAMSPPTF
jgi:2'-5' RNA ligase